MPLGERAGHQTFWQGFGEGGRPALAIHCKLAQSGAWAGVAGALAGRLSVTAFDLPGHGRSGDWNGERGYLTLAVRIAATFAETPLDLIGHSFGAVVALRLAISAPGAIRTLTLIEPVLFAAARGDPEWDAHRGEMAGFDRALAAGDRTRAAEAFTRVWGTGVDWREITPRSREAVASRIRLIEAGNAALYDDSGGVLAAGALERLDMPVLIIRGDQSPAIVARIAANLAARLPDVGVATVPGAGHMAPVTHPSEVAGLIGVNLDRA